MNTQKGSTAKVEGIFTTEGARALEVELSTQQAKYELPGRIEDINSVNRELTLLGGAVLLVPEEAEIKDGAGESIPLDQLMKGDFVKIEGDGIAAWFVVSEVTITADFVCPGQAQRLFTASKPAEFPYKETEHYCVLPNSKRTGATKTSFTDYSGEYASTYTVGKYANRGRQGLWLTINVAGEPISECFYEKGTLLSGDSFCPQ